MRGEGEGSTVHLTAEIWAKVARGLSSRLLSVSLSLSLFLSFSLPYLSVVVGWVRGVRYGGVVCSLYPNGCAPRKKERKKVLYVV